MGKDQDLLDAARIGNIDIIEKLCNQRFKSRTGPLALAPLASLRRTANQNCQDHNGDTPLHLAALNGHCEATKLLLRYEASANIRDSKGCFPLHMAAWNGHAEICRLLLKYGPSMAKVNEQNYNGETALLCACQYGHTDVVSVLLEHHTDPTLRNNRSESPLDLASQYGRIESVHLLLRQYPNLVVHTVEEWSPLHLAARNGHKHVVQALHDAGWNVNRKTDTGSALHESALFGKFDVVKLLLEYGIDVNITDAANRTALEVLSEIRSHISLDIGKLILDYLEGRSFGSPRHSRECPGYPDAPFHEAPSPRPVKPPRDSDSYNSQSVSSSLSSLLSSRPQKPERHKSPAGHNGSRESVASGNSSVFDAPYPAAQRLSDPTPRESSAPIPVPRLKKRSSVGEREASPSPGSSTSVLSSGSFRSSPTLRSPSFPIQETPRKPPRRKLNMVKSSESFRKREREQLANQNSSESPPQGPKENFAKMKPPNANTDTQTANKEPNAHEATTTAMEFSNSPRITRRDSSDRRNENHMMHPIADVEGGAEYDNNNEILQIDNEIYLRKSAQKTTQENTSSGETGPVSSSVSTRPDSVISEKSTSSSRPPSLEFGSKRSSREIPLSPTGYEQPPTPDFPPPSPMTAILGIQEQINPMEKRKSRDMETITEFEFLAPLLAAGALGVRTTEHGTETESPEGAAACPVTEEVVMRRDRHTGKMDDSGIESEIFANGNNPYYGSSKRELQGALRPRVHQGLLKGSLPTGQRRVKSQIFDNLVVHPSAKHKKRISAPGIYANFDPRQFDPVMENDEKDTGQDVPADGTKVKRRPKMERMAKMDGQRLSSHGGAIEKRHSEASPLIDENEEWAKIADIMASFGGGIDTRNSLNLQEIEDGLANILSTAGGRRMLSVGDWLESLGLSQLENTFIAHGFDDMDFMGPNVLEEPDLSEMGIAKPDHLKVILDASSKIPPLKPIADGIPPKTVESWLASLRLSEYIDTFQLHNFTTIDRVRNIWELELTTVLDITTLGHRKRILASLQSPPDPDSLSQRSEGEFVDFTKTVTLNWSYPMNPTDKEFENLNLYKDYTNIKRYGRPDADDRAEEQENGHVTPQDDLDEELSIRPPPEVAPEESPIKQWRHRPEVLIKGCCNYNCMYLGSTLVKNLHGTDSTKESIQKLKKSTENIAKVPTIILSISYRGVKFIDAKSKRVMCEHEISNIFCACQDGENLNYFAYITKDLQSDRHYCHVFSVRSTVSEYSREELATEIILTLGEAFEVAYQVAMRERGLGDGSLDDFEGLLPEQGDALDDGAMSSHGTQV